MFAPPTSVNPFRRLLNIWPVPKLLRWRPLQSGEIPIERPPRSRPSRGRIHIAWHGGPAHPFPIETEDPVRFGDPHR